MIKYEVGQEWQLVNGETVTVLRIDDTFKDGEVYSLGSDSVWRNQDGYCVDKTFDVTFNFSHIVTDVADRAIETSDFSFRLHDEELKKILEELKQANGLFDVLEFGKQVSLATTRKLKEII